MPENKPEQTGNVSALIKGLFGVDLAGLLVVGSLTTGYIWLQITKQEVDSEYAVLLAFVLSLYFTTRKKHAEQETEREIRYQPLLQQTAPPQFYPPKPMAGCCCGERAGNSGTPNISITVNGEKACVERDGHPEGETVHEEQYDDKCFYRIFRDNSQKFRWQLKTRVLNEEGEVIDEIIATSHQGFKTALVCLNEIHRVMRCCHARIIEDINEKGEPTVVKPRPDLRVKRAVPYTDRRNVMRQEFLSGRINEED